MRCFIASYENKKFEHAAFVLSTLAPHLTELSKVFQAGYFNFAQMKASVELCINKLSDAAAKSELKANYEKFDCEFGELRTPDGCVSSRPVTSLGHQEGRRVFREWPKIFELCPIFLNYAQHIFPGGRKLF